MKTSITLKLIAAYAILAYSSAAFAHNSSHMGNNKLPPEQKDWGIAGVAKAATRTLTVTMLDTMRFSPDVLHVKEGETIVTTGQIKLRNGSPVTVDNSIQPSNDANPQPSDQ